MRKEFNTPNSQLSAGHCAKGVVVPIPNWPSLLLGILLTSAATLTLQISIIRLLSVSQGHHFAFMVVSMALLGYGASGSILASFPSLLGWKLPDLLTLATWLFSASALLAYLASNRIPFDLARIAWDRWQIFYIFLLYLAFSIPFFFSGMAISSALTRWSAFSGKLYFSDLTGAALGCLLVLFLFGIFGGPGTLLFSCLLGATASIVFGWTLRSFRIFLWFWIGVLACLLIWQPPWTAPHLSPYKALSTALRFPGARLLGTYWDPISRVDVLESPAARTAPGLSLEYLNPLPSQLGLTVDGDQLNAITRFHGEPREAGELRFLDFLPSSLPYRITRPQRVLILEPKGGLEVLNALFHETKETVVIETNPTIVQLLKGSYGDYSGRIYWRDGVQANIENGRSYLHRAPPPFDLIVLPLSESLGASSSGFIGLHEDYRLTMEAFQEYFRVLKPGGFLFASLYLLPPPRAELRLVSTVREALRKTGKRPADHILAYRSWGTFSLLVKKDPILSPEIESLKSFCQQQRYDLVYYPGISLEEVNLYNRFPQPLYYEGMQGLLREGMGLGAAYPFDLSPATDDRPFFHYFFRWEYWREIYQLAGGKWQILLEGGFLVLAVFFLALTLSLLFIILPVILRQGEKSGVPGVRPFPWVIYFVALGLGFMFVEISLIQRFILFLGHPVYSVSLVIFSLLVSAGMGSRLSMRIDPKTLWRVKGILLGVAGLLFLGAILYPQVLPVFQGKTLILRFVLTFLFITPLGFFMGMPFPLGIRLVGSQRPSLVPWAWCANGCASVLGSILPVILALTWGFQTVFFAAATCYSLALFVIWKYG
jgi:SAM-dependent methyltransferase